MDNIQSFWTLKLKMARPLHRWRNNSIPCPIYGMRGGRMTSSVTVPTKRVVGPFGVVTRNNPKMNRNSPKILEMLELCMSGQAFKIFRLSSLAQIMNAFMGLLMCGVDSFSRLGCRIILAPKSLASWRSKKYNLSSFLCTYLPSSGYLRTNIIKLILPK